MTHEFGFRDSPHALWRVLLIRTKRVALVKRGRLLIPNICSFWFKTSGIKRYKGRSRIAQMLTRICSRGHVSDGGSEEAFMQELRSTNFWLQLQQHWMSHNFPDCIRAVYSTSKDTNLTASRTVAVNVASSDWSLLLHFH
jgi:hypothetical protein